MENIVKYKGENMQDYMQGLTDAMEAILEIYAEKREGNEFGEFPDGMGGDDVATRAYCQGLSHASVVVLAHLEKQRS